MLILEPIVHQLPLHSCRPFYFQKNLLQIKKKISTQVIQIQS